ncbi:MAG: 50S ribosomal protein L4 [Candidatus Omnitrophica bacterium CG07_land_8_20_14_0_80_42_15]|uniref:Large ribosomal subunit protein uL4 n=1 Tax=Candidatus Aquitaenariimonas noxiae TaxID=1974741 RepID=A0A2J0KXA4_9BACT|nr:MAG: 50S ribosomal protein L4 [Candidatus Omnitrophica bacterium CG07_land_8_20_14_0_80_42_15]
MVTKKKSKSDSKTKPQEYKVDVYDTKGKKLETLDLDKRVFNGEVNTTLMHQAVVMYAACKRQGNADTKVRSEVRGGGKKPWRQKGTGRARAGTIRSPLWRHGGIVFGPHPRDYSYAIPHQMRLAAVKFALNSKLGDERFKIIDELKLDEPKTKKMKEVLRKLKADGRTLIIIEKLDENVRRAARNLESVLMRSPLDVSCDDILRCEHLLMTKDALHKLIKRFVS